ALEERVLWGRTPVGVRDRIVCLIPGGLRGEERIRFVLREEAPIVHRTAGTQQRVPGDLGHQEGAHRLRLCIEEGEKRPIRFAFVRGCGEDREWDQRPVSVGARTSAPQRAEEPEEDKSW